MNDNLIRENKNNAAASVNRGDDGSRGVVGKLLGHGKENAITRRDIMALANIRDVRTFYSILHQERDAGTVILNGNGGYFFPSLNQEQARREMQEFKTRQIKTARAILTSLRCVTNALREMPGQETIDSIQKDQ